MCSGPSALEQSADGRLYGSKLWDASKGLISLPYFDNTLAPVRLRVSTPWRGQRRSHECTLPRRCAAFATDLSEQPSPSCSAALRLAGDDLTDLRYTEPPFDPWSLAATGSTGGFTTH